VTVSTPRGAIECKALVTRRLCPFEISGRTVHQVGMPFHWGYRGVVTGDITNELAAMVAYPNVTIHEAKAFMCQVEAGRKAREVRARLDSAPVPVPRVGRRERQAAEANIDRGIELAAAAARPEELLEELLSFPLDQPLGVYHG
jgi:hypothetical protein